MLRVVHVSRGDRGAADTLHRGLRRAGMDSVMFVMERRAPTQDTTVVNFTPPRDLLARIRRRQRFRRLNRDLARYRATLGDQWFFDDRTGHGADPWRQLPACDVVHLHSMARFVDYGQFFAHAPASTVIVRTLHDMSFFTGGCHYAGACTRYTEQCGRCPILGTGEDNDLSRQIWRRKSAAFGKLPASRLHIVAPSHWIGQAARRSRLLSNVPVTVIPLGIDTDIFYARDRGHARRQLGIDEHADVVLFVANGIDRPEKGFRVLSEALQQLKHRDNLLFIVVGAGRMVPTPAIPHRHFGNITDREFMSLVYSAADIMAMPSIQENFPQVALEALACGTPVVASDVGGIPEIVRSGETGYLVRPNDVTALSRAIGDLVQRWDIRKVMRDRARRLVAENFALHTMVNRHVEFYNAVVERVSENPYAV